MLLPGTFLQQRYRIARPLKQGGMGTVYEAVDERLDSTVALKECHFTEEPLRRQFEREARLLARLRHPALTKVIDHFGEASGQFLVMEFIPGEDLSELMQRRSGPLPQGEVLAWADQLLDALDYLHTHEPSVVHRDIKPQNLKLTKRGQIILLDFGLAKGSTGQRPQTKPPDSIFGYTLNYAPLEQIQGTGTDPRSDLYSLAATVYHLLTATVPPDALTRVTEVANEQPDPLRPAHLINSQVSPAVSEVLMQAMSQNREKRPPSAARMRALLRGEAQAHTPLGSDQTIIEPRAGTAPQEAQNAPTVNAMHASAPASGLAGAPLGQGSDPTRERRVNTAGLRKFTRSPVVSNKSAAPSRSGFRWWVAAIPVLVVLLAISYSMIGSLLSADVKIDSALTELDTFTKELVAKVESNPNPSAGVDDAQKYLDSKKADLSAKLNSIKDVRGFQVSEDAKKKMLERITEDVMSVSSLRIKYISMKDPAFKAKLDKLVADYQSLLKLS
jgi:serine/threonine protein kinase